MSTEFARDLLRNQTDAERTLRYVLRIHRPAGHKFHRQPPIGPYIAAFVRHEAEWVIELDGKVLQATYSVSEAIALALQSRTSPL